MGFLAGAVVGLGVLLIHRAWGNPKPVKIPGEFYPLVGSALAGTLVGLAVTGSSVVAVCGAVLGGHPLRLTPGAYQTPASCPA